MLPLNVTGSLKEWLDNRPSNHKGNQEDSTNILLVITPPEDVLSQSDRVINLNDLHYEGEQAYSDLLVATVGRELLHAGDVIILGKPFHFKTAHNTPQWRIWRATYEAGSSDPQFTEDKISLGMPQNVDIFQARDLLKSLITEA